MAVGSVDSKAKVSDFSSTGKEVDVVAPGEAVRATGAFGETMITSGTSMSVPHVVGVASRLWQKDLSKSGEFIKDLVEESAKPLGDTDVYGSGLIDYEYADKMYDTAAKQYSKKKAVTIQSNQSAVETYANKDESKVEGTWSGTKHEQYLTDNGVNLPAMKKGATYPDSKKADAVGIEGMTENPDFHGFYVRKHSNKEDVNYLASYRFIVKIGDAYKRGQTYTAVAKSDISGLTQNSFNKIREAMKKIQALNFFKKYKGEEKRAFILGIAMHTATDAFAHSTFEYNGSQWIRIVHESNGIKLVDSIKHQERRYTMAYRVERNTLYRYQGKRSDVAVCHDFHAAGDTNGTYYINDTANKYYRLCNISKYASQVHISDANVISHYGMINVDRSGSIWEFLE